MRRPYLERIDATARLLEQRAGAYRDLVVAMSVLGIAAFGWALWWLAFRPLVLPLLWMPLCLGFVLRDRLLLNRWRARFLADWTAGAVDAAPLRAALLANPALPKATLLAMLESLPDDALPRQRRESVARAMIGADRRHAARLIVACVLAGLAAVSCLSVVAPWEMRAVQRDAAAHGAVAEHHLDPEREDGPKRE